MFCQIRNSMNIVNIMPCRRKACLCYADFEKKRAKTEGGSIEKKDYEKYKQCYTTKNIFLLKGKE